MVAWAAVYVAFGESKPAIWLLPMLVLVTALAAVHHFAAAHNRPLAI